ncbi:MAG: cytochrome c [Myxococcota bacterium]|nr:cytochrome c [Myxococcota bacterium]
MMAFSGIGCGKKAKERLANTWPDVQGKDLPIPFPLTEAEVAELRTSLLEEGVDHAGEPLAVEEPPGTEEVEDSLDGEEAPPSEWAPDPLQGADLDQIALDRAIDRGDHLANKRLGCAECHGADYAGKLVADAKPVWVWYAPNITRSGLTRDYTAADWDRIVRHGVKPDHTNATMPAVDYMRLSDREVSDLAAYIHSLPAVERVQPETRYGLVGKMLMGSGKMPLAAEDIEHDADVPIYPPDESVSVEFGKHIAQPCVGCHGLEFNGGPIPGGPPSWPDAANLTQADDGLKGWTETDFLQAMREGRRPDGTDIDKVMPWELLGQLSDTELKSMWMYLETLEAIPTGE